MPEVARFKFFHGSKAVGTSAVVLTATPERLKQGIVVKAAAGNSGKVYVGSSSDVTADSAPATDGFELSAGDSFSIEIGDPNKVFVIGSAAAQQVFWAGT